MFKGSIVALVTPFDQEGRVDFPSLQSLLSWHVESGTDGLVLCGSTGEGSSLSREEKLRIFQTAREIVGDRIPLIAATGTNVTEESISLTKEAKRLGMDACMVIVPYYLRPTPEGCYAHFAEIACAGLPMFVYHHPGRTGTKLSSVDLEAISALPGVMGIKDASGDLSLAMELIDKVPHFSGDDTLALAQFSVGFTGSISIIGNVLPKEWKAFVDLALEGKLLEARAAFFGLYESCKAMTLETNPQCVKYALSLLGKCKPHLRLPLLLPKEENRKKIEDLLLAPAFNE